MFRRVIVALDGSSLSEQALPYAIEVARRFAAPVTLLRAFDGVVQTARTLAKMRGGALAVANPRARKLLTESVHDAEVDARTYLDVRADAVRATGIPVQITLVDGSPATAIVDEAHREPSALVVMSTHGRGGLGRFFFGSTAQEVLQKSTVPILLIRARDEMRSAGPDAVDGQEVPGVPSAEAP